MIIHKHKKAYFDYEILKEFNAGIILTGGETKSCRLKSVNLKGAYILLKDNKIILKDAHISRYLYDQTPNYNVTRDRYLLLNQKEVHKILKELNTAGVSLIPLSIFTVGRLIKVKIALARGRKKYDKRELIKNRDVSRKILQKNI